MRFPKRYGQSKVESCPFCGKQSTATNKQGFPVCMDHKSAVLNEMKCACGEYLEIRQGRYGVFFLCTNCGPLNVRKVFEMNEIKDVSGADPAKSRRDAAASRLYKKSAERISRGERLTAVRSDLNKGDHSSATFKKSGRKEITITPDDVYYFS